MENIFNLTILLHTVDKDRSILMLQHLGLQYAQIVSLIELALEEQLIKKIPDEVLEEKLTLTDLGVSFLIQNKHMINLDKHLWLKPLEQARINKLGRFDIYVPEKPLLSNPSRKSFDN